MLVKLANSGTAADSLLTRAPGEEAPYFGLRRGSAALDCPERPCVLPLPIQSGAATPQSTLTPRAP